jgi:LacI family transcriptional regulator
MKPENQKIKRNKTGPDPVVSQQVYQNLRLRIQTLWENSDNTPLPSEVRLCEEYGCSRVTIRRVLADLENEGRVLRLPGKGTYPLNPQSAANASRPHIVWLLSFDFFKHEASSSYVKDFLTALRYHAANKAENLTIDLSVDQSLPLEPRKFAAWARQRKADVVVIRDESLEHQKLLPLVQNGPPVIIWGRQSRCPEIDSVSVDYYGDVKRAVKFLADLGHKRIAFIGGKGDDEPTLARWQAFKDSLGEFKLPPFTSPCPSYNHNDIYQHTLDVVTQAENRPTAIITGGQSCNWACLQALSAGRLRIPDDISVLAIDNFEQAPFYSPPISVIRQPFSLLVEQTLQVARRRVMNPKEPPQNILLNSEIILRESLTRRPTI